MDLDGGLIKNEGGELEGENKRGGGGEGWVTETGAL